MANIITRIFKGLFGIFKKIEARPGLADFLKKYEELGLQIVADLASLHGGEGLHAWEDSAFALIKSRVAGDFAHDNWIKLLIGFAYENVKAARTKPAV